MHFEQQRIIPAISNYKQLRQFLTSSLLYCVILDFQLAELRDVVAELKQHNKKVLVHIDLIKGLAPNEFGAIFLVQQLKIDGIISTKNSALIAAKKRHVIAIQRIFLKDSLSLDKSMAVVHKVQPDYLEILPAISTAILPVIIQRSGCKVICGGLIQSMAEIDACLQHGALSITTSNPELWNT